MKKKLLIIMSDRLSDLVKKGEITPRYYNPGNLFDEVHILMINDDKVNPTDVQTTVGTAKLFIHSLGHISFRKTLGWQPFLLKPWSEKVLLFAQKIQPLLIRSHGNFLNGYFATQIKKRLGIPLVVSLHINSDVDARGRTNWWQTYNGRLVLEFRKKLERETLQKADVVIPVYKSICSYAIRYGAKKIEVIYNVINPEYLLKKTHYKLHNPPRVISVGRQFKDKNPDNLIRAMAKIDAELTLVGNGKFHGYLRRVARECGIADRVIFKPVVPNDDLCQMLPDYDIFATHSEYWEISKSVMEALLTGLPVVLNRRKGKPVPELEGGHVMLVENTKEGYLNALQKLIENDKFREELGHKGYNYAWEHFAPDKMEQKVVNLYRELVPGL